MSNHHRGPSRGLSTTAISFLLACATAAGCSSSSDSAERPAATESALSGRYGPFPGDVTQIWFSGDDAHSYALYATEVEQGTYSYRGDTGKLVLTAGTGSDREFHVDISKRLSDLPHGRVGTSTLTPRTEGSSDSVTTADTTSAPSLAPTCDDDAAPDSDNSAPVTENSDPGAVTLLDSSCPTALLSSQLDEIAAELLVTGVPGDKASDDGSGESLDKDPKVATRSSGSKLKAESSKALSDDTVSNAYNCAAAGATAAVGVGGAVTCGLTALPSGGVTALCYFVGVGTAAAGSLAWCGSKCPGFRDVCPGYKPPSFRETSRLVSRCAGTARYSHWEMTDAALIKQYGRSRPEYRDGDCACPRGKTCPTP